ncbi:response regulator [Eubacterium callanderi]|uniref:response regulator n=1 Tax=Eubacterium callanderi TaxID=53442 RepID=UPI003AF1DED5
MSNVLIIEDEKDTAIPVQQALALEDIKADIATDGATGIQMFRDNSYDLVLLDLKMPKMSGEDVLKELRKIDPFVDVVIYTNYTEFADIKKLTNIGIDGYINKGPDADLSELIETIKEKLAPLDETDIAAMIKDLPRNIYSDNED